MVEIYLPFQLLKIEEKKRVIEVWAAKNSLKTKWPEGSI